MGADKFENEDLIQYGLPEDIWFHVDDMSSAHVYLRLNKNEKLEDISPDIVRKCAQLVKANSIEGCKLREVTVIYTSNHMYIAANTFRFSHFLMTLMNLLHEQDGEIYIKLLTCR